MAGELTSAPALQVDDKNLRAFVGFFESLRQESGAVAIFDRKTCYSVHGEAAFMVARLLYRSTAQVTYIGGERGLPGITFSANLLPGLLRELLVERAEHSVELFEGSGGSWKRTKSASPAKLGDFEDELSRGGGLADVPLIAAVTVAVTEGARVVGLACVDPSRRQLAACEFADDEHFCHLETALVQLGAKECAMPKAGDGGAAALELRRLAEVVSRCGALGSERPRAAFAAKSLEQDLGRLVKGGCIEQYRPILERPQAAAALAGLLSFAELLADSSAHGKYTLALHDTGRYMRLDAAAQRALNVLKSKTDSSDTFSLYGLLNRSKTPMGKRLLKVWLKQPLVDLAEIGVRHDVVEALVQDAALRQDLQMQLRGLPDIERLARKLDRRKATLADLCQLYRASSRLSVIQGALEQHEGQHSELLRSRFAAPLGEAHDAEHLTKFEELLEAAIDLDRVPDEYLIAASYDQELEGLQVEKEGVEAEIGRLAQEAARDLGLTLDKTIKLEWHKASNQRMRCLRITSKEEKVVRKKMQSGRYIELETRKDGVKFTTKPLREAAARLQALAADYDSRQQSLVEQVVAVAATFCEVWEALCGVLAELDVLVAFADLSTAAPKPYVRPTMLPGEAGELVLRGCRHPCVEAQDGVEFIPNDCEMRRGESWFLVITGPNMGGKSTFIRQVGVTVLLAQVGCFVPCDDARLAVRDCIFARVGAGDCQLRGVSTFMAEMLETAAILKGASAQSLVIIDELGRGTSTYDGQALAWSISEHLMRDIGCATLFATHFHELTALHGECGVCNLHVSTAIDEASGSLTMLYQVNEGSCDQSFGIHVAEFAKFPPSVVELAKRKAEELEQHQAAAALEEGGGAAATGDGGAKQGAAKRARRSGGGGEGLRAALLELADLPLEGLEEAEANKRLQQWAGRAAPLLAAMC